VIRRALRRSGGGDRGLTLVELMVTMILLAVVSTLVLTAVQQSSRILIHNQDEAAGLGDAKVILDRLGRDIREARSVTCDGGLADPTDPLSGDVGCKAHLQLWVDSNSDYAQDADEVITWQLHRNPDLVHYDVWRIIGPVSAPISQQRQATSLIVKIAFCYDDVLPVCGGFWDGVEQIRLDMRYDSMVDRGTAVREVAFSARLRNKG
jgi:prepilin-type N-terminal cleavage/methylation domain-containing protein